VEEHDLEATGLSGHQMASEVSDRIRDVIAAAEAAASAIRHEADEQAQARRRLAEQDARRLVEDARRDAEALLSERIRRISALSDTIIERGDGLLGQINHAEDVRREFETLVAALGESAAELAREAAADVEMPSEPERRQPEPEPEPAEAEPADEPPRQEAQPDPEVSTIDSTASEEPVHDPVEPGEHSNVTDLPGVTTVEDAVVEEAPGDGDDQLLGARLVALQMAVAGGNRGEVEAHLRRAFELADPQSILDDVFGVGTDASKRVVWPSAADV
jgi:hypothetical protein